MSVRLNPVVSVFGMKFDLKAFGNSGRKVL